jgi:hypothetical protein
MKLIAPTSGPYHVDDIRDGDPYELSNGYRIECMSGGRDHAGYNALGARVLGSDPDVEWSGTDAGYALSDDTLRAPDMAIDPAALQGGPGWIRGAPPLAVEYAGVGQDEEDLKIKIAEYFDAGTRWVWVVRLVGPQRVDVHSADAEMKTYTGTDELDAPGTLRNPVPVRALFDMAAGDRVTLRNLLQRAGYDDLEAVREEGEVRGTANAILTVLANRGVEVDAVSEARLKACGDAETLNRWLGRAVTADDVGDVLV